MRMRKAIVIMKLPEIVKSSLLVTSQHVGAIVNCHLIIVGPPAPIQNAKSRYIHSHRMMPTQGYRILSCDR